MVDLSTSQVLLGCHPGVEDSFLVRSLVSPTVEYGVDWRVFRFREWFFRTAVEGTSGFRLLEILSRRVPVNRFLHQGRRQLVGDALQFSGTS